ncbi:hypothetical protein [Streptomyces sp. V4I2]|uniref:hypothetical protein n=1 Tax=Streptomyces sp. V4I2 TaxID=3042280 RepID=UPI00277E7826|nr:hypothetical protein [Streptomyces sp. V4I2]MDQ1041804.1 hypothetical protein [Streptomyces sp. V4I2]
MTDTEATRYPETPAEVASAVLDAIETRPDAFNMDHWAFLPGMISLAPEIREPKLARGSGRALYGGCS